MEGNTTGEQYIQPDFFLRREDGNCDILDLKKSSGDFTRVTKAVHARRRFIDYVQEGIAQLANYEEYFSHAGNREHALRTHGIRVDSPQLILVVGNYENFDTEQVREARRMLKLNYHIIDYDSLASAYVLRTVGNPRGRL